MIPPEVHARVFADAGWTLIYDAIPEDTARDIEKIALNAVADVGIFKEGTSSGGGHSKYWVLDGGAVNRCRPDLFEWYEAQLPLLGKITNREVILSPYLRSAINIKVYKGDGNGQGWHYDTNPLSAVLFLSDSGSPLSIRDLQGDARQIEPKAGKLLLMDGREVFHSVEAGNETRVAAVFNYYYSDDCERPEYIDRAIYENVDPPRLT